MTSDDYRTEEDFPISVVDRRLACENTKFNVYFDHVVDYLGGHVRDYLVVSPKYANNNLVTGVAILPFIGDTLGLIRIFRPAIRAYSWEIPHGFVETGENDADSALRELTEETGLAVDLSNLTSLGYITPDSGVIAARVHLFLAEHCQVITQLQIEPGLREFRMFQVHDVNEMIARSEIQDSFTLAALYKYQTFKAIATGESDNTV